MTESQVKLLRSELCTLDALLPKLSQSARVTAPSISQCVSRVHPTKLASDVTTPPDSDYMSLLELIVDRLQYLIQCSACILGSHSPPLSLSSALKKFSQLLAPPDTGSGSISTPPGNPVNSHSHSPASLQNGCSIAVQTFETAFTNCMNCTELQDALLHVACLFTESFQGTGKESRVDQSILSSLDIDSSDLLPAHKWAGPMEEDVAAFSNHLAELQRRSAESERNVKELSSRLFSKNSELRELQLQLSDAKSELVKRSGILEEELGRVREEGVRERHTLSVEREQERLRADQLKSQLSEARQDMAASSTTSINTESRLRQTENALKKREGEVEAGQSLVSCLRGKLEEVERDRNSAREEFEAKSVAVKKLEVQTNSLRQHESKLQRKCDSLLQQVLAMEEEHCRAQQELGESESEKEATEKELSDRRSEIRGLRSEIDRQKQAVMKLEENESSSAGMIERLRESLETAREKVEAADERCRLLMRFSQPQQLFDPAETRDLIAANSLKIMLIEEQNSKLRQESLASSLSGESDFRLISPAPLWHMQDLTRLKQKYSQLALSQGPSLSQVQLPSAAGTPPSDKSRSATDLREEARSSRAKSRGRCGQLLEALSRAGARSCEDVAQGNRVTHVWSEQMDAGAMNEAVSGLEQVHTCYVCDQMFHDQSSLIFHSSHCH